MTVHIETLCEPGAADRVNDDSVFIHKAADGVIMAAIDGATDRIPAAALRPLLDAGDRRLTSAAFAAQTTGAAFAANPDLPPREMLLAANAALREKLEAVYGALTPETIFAEEPELADYAHDGRYIRLALPACVVTLARVDLAAGRLDYAHLGDTALLLFHDDGAVELAAGHNGAISSRGFVERARRVQAERGLAHLRDALDDERVRRPNLEGALYHNFVDENGTVDPSRGVGVIDGLPQAAHYIQTGTAALDGVSGVLVCTDGLVWPAEPDEDPAVVMARLRHMRRIIEDTGLMGYYLRLRKAERDDAGFDRYPRFKLHDDAAGVYLKFR